MKKLNHWQIVKPTKKCIAWYAKHSEEMMRMSDKPLSMPGRSALAMWLGAAAGLRTEGRIYGDNGNKKPEDFAYRVRFHNELGFMEALFEPCHLLKAKRTL